MSHTEQKVPINQMLLLGRNMIKYPMKTKWTKNFKSKKKFILTSSSPKPTARDQNEDFCKLVKNALS